MASKKRDSSGFAKPTASELAGIRRSELVQYVAASMGRLSNLYPHWLLLHLEGPLGISSSRFMVLWLLDKGQSMSMGRIAEAVDLTPRGVSRVVDGLEADGLAKRVVDPGDKRVKNVELTSKGRRFVAKSMPGVLEELVDLFSVLDPSEAVELVRLTEKLTDHMKSRIDERSDRKG